MMVSLFPFFITAIQVLDYVYYVKRFKEGRKNMYCIMYWIVFCIMLSVYI